MVGFPLLLIPLAVYNIIVFLMPGVSFTDTLVSIPLMSGVAWLVTLSDVLLALGVLLLMLEIVKGARPGSKFFMDHLLSLVVFGASAAEFVLWPKFGNSTFFLLSLLAMVDFFSGIALRTRRRAVAFAPTERRAARRTELPAPEPDVEPAHEPRPEIRPEPRLESRLEPRATPEPQMPSRPEPPVVLVDDSVLMDHPEPTVVQPAPTTGESSPKVTSPDLQPGNGTPPPQQR
jgi:hypothetical protein